MSATTSSDIFSRRFEALREDGRRALVVYLTAGHPDPASSLDLMHAVVEAGADVVEIGVPFSDPLADGPVIQRSSQIALEHGTTFEKVLELISRAALSVPVVLFSYLNPVMASGPDALQRASDAGAHGLLITDLPVGADPALEARFAEGPLAFVRLVAPTTPLARMSEIARYGGGFVYLISRLGVTGTRDDLSDTLPSTIDALRSVAALPVCVGFGISTPSQAATVARMADGVVVGSAVVREAERGVAHAAALVQSMRAAMDEATSA